MSLSAHAATPSRTVEARRPIPAIAASLILGFGLLCTYVGWRSAASHARDTAQTHFDGLTTELTIRLSRRLDAYAQILRGGSGLVQATPALTRRAWADYYRELRVPERFPGMQTFLWVPRLAPADVAAFTAARRRDGAPSFHVWTVADTPPATTIAFVQPWTPVNARALGFDMYSEPVRRAAMDRARDTGDIAITGRVNLVIERADAPQAGFIMHLPVYRGGEVPDDVAGRRAALIGFVSSAFRVGDLMLGTLGDRLDDVRLRLHDGSHADPATLMYESGPPENATRPPRFRHVIQYPFGERTWTLDLSSVPAFEARVEDERPMVIALAGVLASGLAAWVGALALSLRRRNLDLQAAAAAMARQQAALEHVNAEVSTARDAALGAARAKSEFLASMSHEIRTPIHGFLGHTELALANRLDAETRGYLETAQACGQALLAVVDDILDFSKLEAGKFPLDAADFRLQDVLLQCMRTVSLRAAEHRLALIWSADPMLPPMLRGDPKRLRQVLLNLLSNSVKFTESGEVELAARATRYDDRGWRVRFEVRDTGIGMDAATRDRLFQAFFQGDASITRRFGGTGLGLAISSRLVTLMGGQFEVSSTPGAGSRFAFEVTLGDLPADRTPPAPLQALLLDPNPRRAEAIRCLMHGEHVRVTACDSAEALVAQATPASTVLLDEAVADAPALARLPAGARRIVLTSAPRHAAARDARSPATCPHPLDPAHLRALIEGRETTATGTAPGASIAPAARPLALLVAEDNPVNQRLIERLLERMGHGVTLVADGAAAVAAAIADRFDAILMDVHMPELDGLEATRRIRAHEAARGADRVPILALTADALPGDRERCLEAGMDGHLTKPIAAPRLQEALEALASERAAA